VVAGRFGLLPGAVATPLALVLTELLQNALQHGLVNGPGPAPAGAVLVQAARGPGQLRIGVDDNGAGLPEGFSLDAHASLGLQIVRTLVESELGGELAIRPRPGGGTSVLVILPVQAIAVPSGQQQPGDPDSARDSGPSENPATTGKAAAG
jgi:two-component sensor histidine kinase